MKKTLFVIAATFAAATTALAANYTISNLGDLQTFMQNAHNPPYYEGDTVTLEADIDCEGGQFTSGYSPVGTVFKGTFDGQGHKIYNFFNKGNAAGTGQEAKYGVAMFDIARDGAVIKNLTLEGDFDDGAATPDYAAAFVAYAIGKTDGTLGLTLENCHFIGSVTNYRSSAAFVGCAVHGSGAPDGKVLRMKNCTARGTVRSDYSYVVGGLVANGEAVEAEDCSFEGNATCRWTLGGLIGKAVDSSFKRCSFKGALGSGLNILGGKDGGCGGLVGFASNSVFRACSSDADIEWNIDTDPYDSDGRINSYNFTADGGAAGVTCGSSAFYDCTAAGTLLAKHGYAGGFVGWTAGAEIFSNCTTSVALQPDARYSNTHGHGGFASTVASTGALFVDCSTSAQGHNIVGGFFNNQHPRKGVTVGTNTFLRCHVENVPAESAGFCTGAWNCTFEGCTVRGGTGYAGFVYNAGRQPDNQWNSGHSYEQTSTFTDCSVLGTRARSGFVTIANYSEKNGHTNVFRRCRAGCVYGDSNASGAQNAGFVYTLNKGTLIEDCAAYGIADLGDCDAGFATSVSSGTTIRRSVAAVVPGTTDNRTAGFAYTLYSGAVVEDCYAVYGPRSPAVYGNGYYDYQQGYQGGFVRSCRIGQTEGSSPIRRSFALWPVPATACPYVGSFAAVTPYSDHSTDYFEDCYRPAESPIGDCNNSDAEGVDALSRAEFATATAATMPNYDFANVWHAPAAVGASSPYLDASVDENTNFWFFATVIGAEGKILINNDEPKEAYPAGSVLTVEAVADNPDMPFAGWIGEGFANPASRVTTYKVKNVSAIGARFAIPIYTVDDWTNMVHGIGGDSFSGTEAFALMNDLDFTDYIAKNGWNDVSPSGFYGKFFGQGHTIRGLVSTNGYFSNTRALFEKIANGAEIRDLTVESAVYPGSGIDNDYNTVCMAGLVCDVGSGSLISNCHTRVDCHGQFPPWAQDRAYSTSMYYGLARNVNGTGIRIIDCTVEGTMIGCSEVAGLIGSADITGSEIARCSATGYFCATNSRSMPHGRVSGLVGEITLRGGSTVRECFAAGIVDGAYYASGFAYKIALCDDQSTVRDCYSTAEVVTREGGGVNDYGNATGFAQRIEDYNDDGGVTIANCWFGGTARALSGESGHSYGFAWLLSGDVAFQNCKFVQSDEVAMEDPVGVTAIDKAARLSAASWAGYDIGGKWTMTAGKTAPYFAWSLKDGGFRAFAFDETPGTRISVPDSSVPGSPAPIAADAEDSLVLDTWLGATDFDDAHAFETTFLADNHRTIRATWKASTPPAALKQTVTFDGREGSPASQQREYVQGGKYSPFPDAPVRLDFEFLGWSPVEEGGALITTETVVTPSDARTFYAQWKAVVYDPLPGGTVTIESTTNTYDGVGHGIVTNVVANGGIEGITLKFAESDLGAGVPPDEWFDEMPAITNAGQIKVWCMASAPGYRPITMWASATIEPKPLADGMFTLLIEPPTHYNGMAHEPDVAATDGNPSIITAGDYDVEFTDNLNAGTATATFTGKGNYTGTATASFEIEPCPVTLKSADNRWIYTGATFSDTRVEAVNFVDGEGVTTNNFATIRDAGFTPNTFDYAFNEGTLSNNYEVTVAYGTLTVIKAWFDDEPGSGTVTPGKMSKFDGVPVVYDGLGHMIDVDSLTNAFNEAIIGDGTVFQYALDDGAGPVEPWAAEAAVFTNAGEHVVWYRVTNPNYSNFVHAAKVTITPRDINLATLSLDGVPVTYNGAEQKPAVVAADGDPSIICEDDYTVAYANNVNAGTATVTVTGRNNYQGEATLNFTIDPKELTADMITLAETELQYDGTEQKPEVVAADGNPSIITPDDYDVAYADNVNVGTATVTVTGKRNYTGEVEKQFEITKRPVTLASADGTWTYDGTPHSSATVVVTGFLDGQGATADNFATITDVGSAPNTFEYTLNEGTLAENYEITVSNGTLTVEKADIGGGTEEPGSGSVPPGGSSKFDVSVTYDGQGHTINTNALVEAFNAVIVGDGTVFEYMDDDLDGAEWSTEPPSYVNSGEHRTLYRVTNTNYNEFVHLARVMINPKELKPEMLSLAETEPVFSGTNQEPAVVAVDGDPSIISENDFTVTYSNNVEVGTAFATVTAQSNYYGEVTLNFTIGKKEMTAKMITLDPMFFEYTGAPKEPGVTVAIGDYVATAGTDYDVEYLDNVEIGVATAKVTGKGKNFTGEAEATFEIVDSFIVFRTNEVSVAEGGTAVVRVLGGRDNVATSVKVYLTYQNAAAADLDLAGKKFPMTLKWEAGEVGLKEIEIPVKATAAFEADEVFTLQLAGATGMAIGEPKICTVTIAGDEGEPTAPTGAVVFDGGYYMVNKKKGTATATAFPGYVFTGWTLANGKVHSTKATIKESVRKSKKLTPKFAKAAYLRALVDDPATGSVKGQGLYSAGKKVTLKAPIKKGYAFTGWRTLDGDLLSQATSLKVTTGETMATYIASFKKESELARPILALTDSTGATSSQTASGNDRTISVGVAYPAAISVAGEAAMKIAKVTGLPKGLKFKGGKISGIPTKTGKFTASVTVALGTNKKKKWTCKVPFTVIALPEWARGKFTGMVTPGWAQPAADPLEPSPDSVAATMSVGTTGKISGKFALGGTNWTFSAKSYAKDSVVTGDVVRFVATMTAKGTWKAPSGKKMVSKTVTVPMGFTLIADAATSEIASATESGYFGEATDEMAAGTVEFVRDAGVRVTKGGATAGGTVSLSVALGQAASNKTVKATAKLKKGYALAGWYLVEGGETNLVSQSLVYSLRMAGDDVFLVAEFVKESDLSRPELVWNGKVHPDITETNLTMGVAYEARLAVAGEVAVKITKVTGLPAGLAYKGGKVTGVPTKAGRYAVTVAVALVTNAKKAWTYKVTLVVGVLPDYAKGAFSGVTMDGATPGLAAVSVGVAGKVSGKFYEGGTNWTFSANGYTVRMPPPASGLGDVFICSNLVATYSWKEKSGKKTVTKSVTRQFTLAVGEGMSGDAALGFATAEENGGDVSIETWQNRWGGDYKAVGAALFWTSAKDPSKTWASVEAAGRGTYDTLSMTVSSSGAVTAKYKFFKGTSDADGAPQFATYTCATAMIPTSPADPQSFTGYVPIYLPPVAATGFPGFCAEVAYPFTECVVPEPLGE